MLGRENVWWVGSCLLFNKNVMPREREEETAVKVFHKGEDPRYDMNVGICWFSINFTVAMERWKTTTEKKSARHINITNVWMRKFRVAWWLCMLINSIHLTVNYIGLKWCWYNRKLCHRSVCETVWVCRGHTHTHTYTCEWKCKTIVDTSSCAMHQFDSLQFEFDNPIVMTDNADLCSYRHECFMIVHQNMWVKISVTKILVYWLSKPQTSLPTTKCR